MESYYGYCHHHDLSLLYWNCLGETWMSRALWAFEWRCNRWFFYDSWGSWAGIKRLKQLNFGTWQTYRTHAQLFRVVLWITRIDWTPICPYPKWRQWTKKHTLQNLPIISVINIRRGMKSDFKSWCLSPTFHNPKCIVDENAQSLERERAAVLRQQKFFLGSLEGA